MQRNTALLTFLCAACAVGCPLTGGQVVSDSTQQETAQQTPSENTQSVPLNAPIASKPLIVEGSYIGEMHLRCPGFDDDFLPMSVEVSPGAQSERLVTIRSGIELRTGYQFLSVANESCAVSDAIDNGDTIIANMQCASDLGTSFRFLTIERADNNTVRVTDELRRVGSPCPTIRAEGLLHR